MKLSGYQRDLEVCFGIGRHGMPVALVLHHPVGRLEGLKLLFNSGLNSHVGSSIRDVLPLYSLAQRLHLRALLLAARLGSTRQGHSRQAHPQRQQSRQSADP